MLKHIPSTTFIEAIILVTALYYAAAGLLFYRNEIRVFLTNKLLKRPAARGKAKTPL